MEKKMKRIFTKGLVITFILSIMLTPVYAVSSEWSMTMSSEGRIVDGSKNGVYHKLDKGKVCISGTMKTIDNKSIKGGVNKVHITLYNKTTGNYFGDVTVTPSEEIGGKVSISGTYEESVGGGTKYYLYVWRGGSDGTALNVNKGTLKNK